MDYSSRSAPFVYDLLCYIIIYSLLLAMTLAEEDEKRFEREKEWEDFKNHRLGAGGDSIRPGQLTE